MQYLGNRRFQLFLLAILPALALTFAYYLEYYQGLEPCPLCMLQRVPMLGLVLLWLISAFIYPYFKKTIATLATLMAVCGGLLSARHVWIQSIPADEVPACGPSFEYLFNNFPWLDALKETILTSGQCAKVDWMFMGMTLPMMTLLFFASWAGFGLYMVLKK